MRVAIYGVSKARNILRVKRRGRLLLPQDHLYRLLRSLGMLDDHTTAFTSIIFQRRPPIHPSLCEATFHRHSLSPSLSGSPLHIFLSVVLFFSSLVIQSDLEGQVRFVDFLANNENATPDVLHLVAQSLDQPGDHNQAKIIIQVQSNYDFSILINLACLCNVSVALSLGLMFHTIPEISVMPESHKHWKMSLKILLSWKVT